MEFFEEGFSGMPRRHLHPDSDRGRSKSSFLATARAICNHEFSVITGINLLVMTVYYLTFVTSAVYVQATYETSLSVAGLSAGIMVIGCLVGRFFSGNLLSTYGCRAVLLAGLGLFACAIAASLLNASLIGLFVLRFLTGAGTGITGTATGTIIAYVVPKEHHGFGISLFSMSTALALALGPFLGITLTSLVSYATTIGFTLVLSLACLGLALSLHSLPAALHHHRPLFRLDSYVDPRVVPFACVALLICLGYGCIQAFLSTCAAERDLSAAASLYFLVYGVATILSRPVTGRLFDRRGENVLLVPVFLLTALALWLLAHAHSGAVLLLSGLILGLGFGNFQSIGQAVSLAMVTPSRFAQATTTFFILFDLGIGLGPYVFGFLVPSMGFSGMYTSLALTTLAALVVYHFVHARRVRFY